MPVLIGTDEAGYGPNLGPLVITATTWHLPEDLPPAELMNHLQSAVTGTFRRGETRLHVADSKQVYTSGKPITELERSVMAFCKLLPETRHCHNVLSLGTSLSGPQFQTDYAAMCGDGIADLALPLAADPDDCHRAAETLTAALADAGIKLLQVQSRILFPEEFNALVEVEQSKGKVLSVATLQLVKAAIDHPEADRHGHVVCDKHGGRNRYDDLISAAFDDAFVFRIEESGPQSRYRVHDLEFCFRTKAEELLPVALASMVCKYVRETVMLQFNAFWQQHLPELKPTKGYPMDAKRFLQDIAGKAVELNITESTFWRNR